MISGENCGLRIWSHFLGPAACVFLFLCKSYHYCRMSAVFLRCYAPSLLLCLAQSLTFQSSPSCQYLIICGLLHPAGQHRGLAWIFSCSLLLSIKLYPVQACGGFFIHFAWSDLNISFVLTIRYSWPHLMTTDSLHRKPGAVNVLMVTHRTIYL